MRRAVDSLVVFVGALAVYVALGQRTFYGVDGWMLVRRVAAGDVRSDMHLLYKPIAHAAVAVGRLVGLSVYEAMVLASAVGTAVGVALLHAAARVLGATRRDAVLVAAVAGAFPGVVFYATVVERHGPFFAFAGGTALAAAWIARSPTMWSGAGFALACTLAYAAHSTGVLMVAAFLPLAAAWARSGVGRTAPAAWRPVFASVTVAAVGTAAGMLAARRLGLWTGVVEREGDNLAFFMQHAAVHIRRIDMLPACAWNELLTAFAPMSVLWLLAFRDEPPRIVAWATTAAVGVYFVFSFLILGDFDERGAYALPLAWPLAWVAVRRLPRVIAVAALVLSAALSIVEVTSHDDRHLDAWADGMFEIAGDRTPFVIAAAWQDFELVFLHQPGAASGQDFYDAFDAHGFDAAIVRDNAALLIGFLLAQRDRGRELLLTEPGLGTLRDAADPGKAGPLVVEVLESGFVLEPVERAAFRGYRLVPRE